MWYTTDMKHKIYLTVVLVMLCVSAFLFAGFKGEGGGSVGTFNTSDGNRFVVFTSKAQLDEYCLSHEGDLFNLSAEQRARCDDEFFKTQALVMFLTDGMSGSIKVSCEGYELKGCELHVTVKEMSPLIHTMDLRYNVLTVAAQITKVVLDTYRVEI